MTVGKPNANGESGLDPRNRMENCGASARERRELYKAWFSSGESIGSLVAICTEQESLQDVATWLMKYHLRAGYEPTPDEEFSMFALLSSLKGWEARLHLLQMLDWAKAPAAIGQQSYKDCLYLIGSACPKTPAKPIFVDSISLGSARNSEYRLPNCGFGGGFQVKFRP